MSPAEENFTGFLAVESSDYPGLKAQLPTHLASIGIEEVNLVQYPQRANLYFTNITKSALSKMRDLLNVIPGNTVHSAKALSPDRKMKDLDQRAPSAIKIVASSSVSLTQSQAELEKPDAA